MTDTVPEQAPKPQAPELENPVGNDGLALMGLASWGPDTSSSAEAEDPAQLRALAEKLLAAADKLENKQ